MPHILHSLPPDSDSPSDCDFDVLGADADARLASIDLQFPGDLDWASVPRQDEEFPSQNIKLERRGTTSHATNSSRTPPGESYQGNFWNRQTVFKNSIAAKLRSIGAGQLASDLEFCHSEITYCKCTGCGTTSKFLNRCDRFYCPECQPKLSMERKESVEWWTKQVQQPKHVVLTQTNSEFLTRDDVQGIKASFSRLRRMAFARNWKGGFYSLEVTNEGRGWHLHIHALVDSRWIDSGGLAVAWNKATRGRGHIVKVKDCRDKSYLQEVTKYAVKGSDLASWTGHQILEFIEAFRGVRQFGVFGSLYGLRSAWSEQLKKIRDSKQVCQCGCSDFHFFDEARWELFQAQLSPQLAAHPKPQPDGHLEFGFVRSLSMADAIR